jgi:hypothetical protein
VASLENQQNSITIPTPTKTNSYQQQSKRDSKTQKSQKDLKIPR